MTLFSVLWNSKNKKLNVSRTFSGVIGGSSCGHHLGCQWSQYRAQEALRSPSYGLTSLNMNSLPAFKIEINFSWFFTQWRKTNTLPNHLHNTKYSHKINVSLWWTQRIGKLNWLIHWLQYLFIIAISSNDTKMR